MNEKIIMEATKLSEKIGDVVPVQNWNGKKTECSMLIAESLQSAFNAGAEKMRVLAAEKCDYKNDECVTQISQHAASGKQFARIIRTIPLPAYGEKK